MGRISSFFDYIFYRVYNFFQLRGDNVPETKGSLVLSLIQFLTILDIMVIVQIFYYYSFPSKLVFFLPVLITIGVFNWYRYERGFDMEKLEHQWKNEDQGKRIMKGWFIGLYLFMSFVIPAVYGYLKHNLKMM